MSRRSRDPGQDDATPDQIPVSLVAFDLRSLKSDRVAEPMAFTQLPGRAEPGLPDHRLDVVAFDRVDAVAELSLHKGVVGARRILPPNQNGDVNLAGGGSKRR